MKKAVFAVLCFVLVLSHVNAYTYDGFSIKYRYGDTSGVLTISGKTYQGYKAYYYMPFIGHKVNDMATLNNLAYIGNATDDPLVDAVVQLMLLEELYPDYEFTLLCDNVKVDTDATKKSINIQLEEYAKVQVFDSLDFTGEYNESLTIKSNYDLGNYTINGLGIQNYNDYIVINKLPKAGNYKIELQNSINTWQTLIYAKSIAYQPVSLNINAKGNIVKFNVAPVLNKYYNFSFKIYDTYNNYLNTQSINYDNNEIYFKEGTNARIVSVKSGYYDDVDDIYITENSTHQYEIQYEKKLWKGNVMFYFDHKGNLEHPINLTIYDTFFNVVENIVADSSVKVTLDYGQYILKDNNKNSYQYFFISNNNSEFVVYNKVMGIISNKKIDKIFKGEQEISFLTDNESYYLFRNPQIIDKYTFLIDGKLLDVDFNNPDNLLNIIDVGTVYYLNIKEDNVEEQNDVLKEELEPNIENLYNEITEDEIIDIAVPDTEVPLNRDFGEMYFEEDNRKYINITIFNNDLY